MTRKEQLKKEIQELKDKIKPLDDELTTICREEAKATREKMERCAAGVDSFEASELVFSAFTRCHCGAGLAYPVNIGIGGYWDCSAILMNVADKEKTHTGQLPFAFYSIKSEGQPSAGGATTRPK